MQNCNGENHFCLEISPAYDALVTSLRQDMEKVTWVGCICRVSEEFESEIKKAYIPQKIPIGPLHRGKIMEDHKWRYLYDLLNRGSNLEASLDSCVQALKELEDKARSCYTETLDRMESDDFVKMMLVDGGFIIELFLKNSVKGLKRRSDPIFTTTYLLDELRCDMMLLENQIPFFILQKLFQIAPIPKQCSQSLTDLAFRFFKKMIPGDHQVHKEKFSQEGNHLLDLIRNGFLPTIQRIHARKPSQRKLHCATMLQEDHGVKLKKARTANLLDIKFANGVLEIPPLHVHHYTETLLRNLIAFEMSCRATTTHHITSYVILMRSLIRSGKDVKLLRRRGILTSPDDESEDENDGDDSTEKDVILKLFESLDNIKVGVHDFYFDGLCEQVMEYKAPSWFARSVKTKKSDDHDQKKTTSSPCSMLSVVAVSLLVLTFVGTLFSVISFFSHH